MCAETWFGGRGMKPQKIITIFFIVRRRTSAHRSVILRVGISCAAPWRASSHHPVAAPLSTCDHRAKTLFSYQNCARRRLSSGSSFLKMASMGGRVSAVGRRSILCLEIASCSTHMAPRSPKRQHPHADYINSRCFRAKAHRSSHRHTESAHR